MAITLAGIPLPDDMQWADELEWEPIEQQLDRTVTGALVIQESTRSGGRPITLTGVWVSRATALQLRTLADQAGVTHTLVLRAQSFAVRFRRPALVAAPVFAFANPEPTDAVELSLNLIQV